MRASNKMYQDVAKKCSRYSKCSGKDCCTNSTRDCNDSSNCANSTRDCYGSAKDSYENTARNSYTNSTTGSYSSSNLNAYKNSTMDSYKNSMVDHGTPSCLNCSHFKQEHCDLDLYDEIADTIH